MTQHPPRSSLLLAALLVLRGLPCTAQEVSEPGATSSTSSLAGQIELARLVDLAAARLGYVIEYDAQVLKGTVTLRGADSVGDRELWSLTNRVLASRGFTTVQPPGDGGLSVVRLEAAAGIARIEPTGQSAPGIAGFQTVLLGVSHRPARELADAVRAALSKPGGVVAELGTSSRTGGSLLVSDLVPRLEQARELLRGLDVHGAGTTFATYSPRSTDAASLIAMANQIAEKQKAVTGASLRGELLASPSGTDVLIITPESAAAEWLSLLERLDTRQASETRTYAIERFGVREVAELLRDSLSTRPGSGSDVRIVEDSLSGVLIITATPADHERMRAVFERLAKVGNVAPPMRTFAVKNRPVAELLASLNSLLDAGAAASGPAREGITERASQRTSRVIESALAGGDTDHGAAGAQGGGPIAQTASPEGLRITADESTNSLIALGDPLALARLEALVRELDVPQPQVMLDVMLVSVSESDALTLGVELEKLGMIDNAATRVASLFGLSTSGSGGRTAADGTGFVGSVLNPGEFSLVVRALESVNAGNSLSNPKVLVTNNEQAVFSSTVQQPFVTQTRTGTSDTTTSYGGSESAGTTISVRPQIARGDHVLLTYSIKLSSFIGSPTSAGLPPPKQENSVDSMATIPDGHTVVVGGMQLVSDSDGESRVPGLGRIPLLGNLFKTQSRSGSRTRFYVFIRPSVLRHSSFEDLKYISGRASSDAGLGDGLPPVTPRIIR